MVGSYERRSITSSPSKFFERHKDILMPMVITTSSTQEDVDKSSIQKSYKTHLVNLGLLKIKFKKPKKGEFPEFDEKTGMMKTSGYELTELGRLLLTNMDMEIS